MKKLFLLPIFLLLISLCGYGQVLQNSNWVTPPTGLAYDPPPGTGSYAPLTFPTYPVPNSYGFISGSASVSDMNGNILLFSDGVRLWKNNPCGSPTITEITSSTVLLKGNQGNAQNVIFIPKPGNPNNYYVVTLTGSGQYPSNFNYPTGSGLYYSEVNYVTGQFVSTNVTLSSYAVDTWGNVLQPTLIDRNYGNTSEAITSTLDANGKDYLLIAHIENRTRGGFIFTYKITCNGIHSKPFEWTPLTIFSTPGNNDHSSMLKVSPKIGSQLQKIGLTSTIGTYISDFNNANGKCVGGFSNIATPNSYGIEFSPSSNAVYFTDDNNIYGYDVTNLTTPILSQPNVEGGLQLGIDGRIYAAHGGIINAPNVLTNPNYVPFNASVSTEGLPQWVHWQQDPSGGTITANNYSYTFNSCLPSTINVPIPQGTSLSIVGWPATCGINISSSGVLTIPAGTTGGPFIIKYQLCNGCLCSNIGTITLTNAKVTLTPPQVGPICAGDYLAPLPTVLNGISGSWSPALDNLHTTLYTFTPSNLNCADPVSITIQVNPVMTPTFPGLVTEYCVDQIPVPLPANSFEGYPGTWSGPSGPTSAITQSGTYTFHPNVNCGRDFSVYITVKPIITPEFDFPTTICAKNLPFTLPTSSNNNPPISGTWTGPSGQTTTVTQSGNYTFTPGSGTCVVPVTIYITVVPAQPWPTFHFPTVICSGNLPFQLPLQSDEPYTGYWEYNGNVVTTVNAPGTYVFYPDPQFCSHYVKIVIKIVDGVAVTPIFHFPTIICKGDEFPQLPQYSDNNPPISGTWSSAGAGVYIFTPDIQNPCVSSVAVTIIEVQTPIVPDFNLPTEICQGSLPPVLPIDQYPGTWAPDHVDTSQEGTFTFTFTPDTGNCIEKVTIEIKVIKCCVGECPLPKIHCFGFDPTNNPNDIYENMAFVNFSANSVPSVGITFTWYFTFYQTMGPIVIHTFYGQNPTFDVFCEDDRPVMSFALLVSNGSSYDKFYAPPHPLRTAYNIPGFTAPSPTCFKHDVCTNHLDGDMEYHQHYKTGKSKAEISVYPNPAKSVVRFDGEDLDKCSITIYDLVGNVIVKQAGLENEINIERLASGVYLYSITGENNDIQTGKIVKQ